jgi:hypothetical protein
MLIERLKNIAEESKKLTISKRMSFIPIFFRFEELVIITKEILFNYIDIGLKLKNSIIPDLDAQYFWSGIVGNKDKISWNDFAKFISFEFKLTKEQYFLMKYLLFVNENNNNVTTKQFSQFVLFTRDWKELSKSLFDLLSISFDSDDININMHLQKGYYIISKSSSRKFEFSIKEKMKNGCLSEENLTNNLDKILFDPKEYCINNQKNCFNLIEYLNQFNSNKNAKPCSNCEKDIHKKKIDKSIIDYDNGTVKIDKILHQFNGDDEIETIIECFDKNRLTLYFVVLHNRVLILEKSNNFKPLFEFKNIDFSRDRNYIRGENYKISLEENMFEFLNNDICVFVSRILAYTF